MKFENKGSGPKGGRYLICYDAYRKIGCHCARWRYDEFEASFLAFVRELDLESILGGGDELSNRQGADAELAALRGEISSVSNLMQKTYELLATGGAVEFVSSKLAELDSRRKDLESRLHVKERERSALEVRVTGFYDSKSQIQELLSRLQNPGGDDVYKIRAQVASKLKSLIDSVHVAPLGDAPRVNRSIEFLLKENLDGGADVIEYLRRSLVGRGEHRRYFVVGFKDGTVRGVYPSMHDPLTYEEQVLHSGSALLSVTPESERVLLRKSKATSPSDIRSSASGQRETNTDQT